MPGTFNMELLISFCVAVMWLQLPSEGESISHSRTYSKIFINRRSTSSANEISNGELKIRSDEISTEESSYNRLKAVLNDDSDLSIEVTSSLANLILKNTFSEPLWKTVIMVGASPKIMASPTFREKWNITDKDREAIEDKKHLFSPETRTKLEVFFGSRAWKGVLVLSSNKDELVDPEFREMWGLGELSSVVKESVEGGKFFDGPQWREFVQVTDADVKENASVWEKTSILTSHLESVLGEIDKLK